MSKQIFLKEWIQPMAELHAISVVEDELGLTDRSSKEYQKEFEKAFYEFCDDLYTHSLTPMAGNPTIRKGINAYIAFDRELFDGRDSFINKNYPNREEAKANIKRLKTAVQTITEIFMGGKHSGLHYEYREKTPDNIFTLDDENKAVDIERFKRLFITSYILSMVNELYKTKSENIYSFLEQNLKNVPAKSFRDHKVNIAFAERIKKAIEGVFGGKDVLGLFLKK
ncbi:MAG: hypothetical protein H7836_04525 [Magnetococcus sp. YQC-3]